MRLYHFVLVFVIIAISSLIILDIKTNDLKAVINNREQINRNLDTAIDDGVTRLVQVDINHNMVVKKEDAIECFFMSLYSSFGAQDKTVRERLDLYIPVVMVTMEDGYYVFYSDEYVVGGYTYTTKRWSEKMPFYFQDSDFVYGFTLGDVVNLYDKNGLLDSGGDRSTYQLDYHELITKEEFAPFRNARPDSILLSEEAFESVRKSTVMKCIESSMAYYTSRHNLIAQQQGITYNFSLPAVKLEEWEPYLGQNSMFVVFQGYSYGDGIGEAYNRVASAGAKISKGDGYYLEQVDWYLICHKSTCSQLLNESIIFRDEPYYSVEACVEAGAYACPDCISNNVYAPGYTTKITN